MKEHHLDAAQHPFGASGVRITTEGRPLLDAPLGSDQFERNFIDSQVFQWADEVCTLTKFAATQLHTTHAVFIHGLSSMWTYLTSVCKGVQSHFEPCEAPICA